VSLNQPAFPSVELAAEDLIVTSLSVQGGEAVIAGERAAFARILMCGIRLAHFNTSSEQTPTRQVAVLKLDVAEELIAGLHEIMNLWARSSPTPVVPARGIWSWTSEAPPGDDIFVTQVKAGGEEIRTADQSTPIIRLDFTGILLKASTTDPEPVRMPGAIFTVPRHVQALISSLKKCTLALRPETELRFLGFSIPSLEADSPGSLQPSWPQG